MDDATNNSFNACALAGGMPKLSQNFNLFVTILLSMIMLVGTVGNLLVIIVVGRYSSMFNVANILLMSLAIADSVYLLFIPIPLTTINMEDFVFGKVGCKVFMISQGVNWFAGTYSLTAMSIDRYLAVVHPISSQGIRTTNVTILTVLCLWAFSFIIMIPIMLYSSHITIPPCEVFSWELNTTVITSPAKHKCILLWSDKVGNMFTYYGFTLGFFIPVVCIGVLYWRVILRLQSMGPEKRSKERQDSIRRISRLVLVIVLAYVAFWFPYWLQQLILPFVSISQSIGTYLAVLSLILNYANSMVNPILYAFMSQNFREMFARLLCCKSFRNARQNSEMATHGKLSHSRQVQIKNQMNLEEIECKPLNGTNELEQIS